MPDATPTTPVGAPPTPPVAEAPAPPAAPPSALDLLTDRVDRMEEALASLGAPQITQAKHDGLMRFRQWFEDKFET